MYCGFASSKCVETHVLFNIIRFYRGTILQRKEKLICDSHGQSLKKSSSSVDYNNCLGKKMIFSRLAPGAQMHHPRQINHYSTHDEIMHSEKPPDIRQFCWETLDSLELKPWDMLMGQLNQVNNKGRANWKL